MTEKEKIIERIEELTGWKTNLRRFKIVTDTSDWMRIIRGDVLKVHNRFFLVRGNMHESRFGIADQPKYWVFNALDLDNDSEKIIKAVFKEEFIAHIGILKIRCYRDVDKESKVMATTTNDDRFMHGKTYFDEKGNNVRVIDFIKGKTFFELIPSIECSHLEYFENHMGKILWRLKDAVDAIKLLHDNDLCHGDVRNDHIIIDRDTGLYRWIDFDLKQDVSDFDLWSLGNILSYTAGKGINSFDTVLKSKNFSDKTKQSLIAEDGSAFYKYRIMNLRKLYPYLPDKLSLILQHFLTRPVAYYSSIGEFVDDYYEMLESDFSDCKPEATFVA